MDPWSPKQCIFEVVTTFSCDKACQYVWNMQIAQFCQNGPLVNYKFSFRGIRNDTVQNHFVHGCTEMSSWRSISKSIWRSHVRSREESGENRFPFEMKHLRRNWTLVWRQFDAQFDHFDVIFKLILEVNTNVHERSRLKILQGTLGSQK